MGRPRRGSAAALTVAFAARLVAMVARCSRDAWEEAGGVRRRRTRSERVPSTWRTPTARAWEEALAALRGAEAALGDDARRDFALEQKLEAAAAAPLEIAELGADVAALAALAGHHCDATYRADAAAAAALAAGGSAARRTSRRVNLGVRATDQRLARARASEQAAQTSRAHPRVDRDEPDSSLPDAELVRRCRDRRRRSLERARRALLALRLRDLPRGFRLSDEDAEDVFQDVFTRVYTRLDSLRDDCALRPWIAQLTRRRCLDALATRAARAGRGGLRAGGERGSRRDRGGVRRA